MLAVAMVFLAAVVRGQDRTFVRTVEHVDLDRYAGLWYEVARLPNRFQQRCAGDVTAQYARRADGGIAVVNRCRTADGHIEAEGLARVVDQASNAKLRVRFAPAWLSLLPMVWGDYWIIGLAEDYSWAVVGSPDRKSLWVLSRRPALDGRAYDAAIRAARDNGFDTAQLTATRQADAPRRDFRNAAGVIPSARRKAA